MDDIRADASPKYRAAHDSGARQQKDIGWCVVHSTEGATAEGAASWFANPKSEGSANVVVDDNTAFRTVPDLVIPWAAPPLNKRGWHLEFAGYARWTTEDWMKHSPMLHRGAYKMAIRCVHYNIPIRWVGKLGLLVGRKGITTHKSITDAWHASTHQDPGAGFPKTYFLDLVKQYAAELRL